MISVSLFYQKSASALLHDTYSQMNMMASSRMDYNIAWCTFDLPEWRIVTVQAIWELWINHGGVAKG